MKYSFCTNWFCFNLRSHLCFPAKRGHVRTDWTGSAHVFHDRQGNTELLTALTTGHTERETEYGYVRQHLQIVESR